MSLTRRDAQAAHLPDALQERLDATLRELCDCLTIERAQRQARKRDLVTAIVTVDCGALASGAAAFPGGVHLPESAEIASVCVDNNSATALNLYEGPAPSGRLLCIVKASSLRVLVLPDAISSISIAPAAAGTPGLVVVTVTTAILPPFTGAN